MKNANPSLERGLLWENAKRNAVSASIVVFVIALICVPLAVAALYQTRDAAGAPTRQGAGTVVRIVSSPVTGNHDPLRSGIFIVRLYGDDVVCNSSTGLFVGEPVQVSYQVGKSGVVYVNDIEPAYS